MRILLADDDNRFGPVLRNELEAENYYVDLVSNGYEAVLRVLDGNKYDVVLLDIMMPLLDGRCALSIIKRLDPEIPVITFSGGAGKQEINDSLRLGAVKCLSKPFEIKELKYHIDSLCLRDQSAGRAQPGKTLT